MCSEKTLYNYVDACLFDVRNIDLPRKVKYRPRYKKPEFKVDRACRNGRNYQEFQKFMASNPELQPVQMDSVIGSIGGKVLLTIHFVEQGLQLAFLRRYNDSQSVIDIFNRKVSRPLLYGWKGQSDGRAGADQEMQPEAKIHR